LRRLIRIRLATEKDIPSIEKSIAEWLNREISREKSLKRAITNNELLVADQLGKVIGFIHSVMHEDIIDGGLNSFITAFYVSAEFRNKSIGSSLLCKAIEDSLDKGAVGIETSTASLDARRLYERHHFKQFMGNGTMGEVFLELDVPEYRKNLKKPTK
jgi:ribosomal protein S18 acetylase RimI-like enzyme